MFTVDPQFSTDALLWYQSQASPSLYPTFTCNSITFYGGSGVFPGITNDFVYTSYNTLQPHNVLFYTITFSLVNTWTLNDGFILSFIGTTTESLIWTVGASITTPYCSFNDIKVKGKVLHSGATLNLKIQKLTNEFSTFGFRKISIRLDNSSPPTSPERFCLSSNTVTAYGWVVSNQCTCPTAYYLSGSSCLLCDQSCEECYGPSSTGCYTCKFGYYHDGTQCTPCTFTCTNCGTCGICSEYDFYMDGQCISACESPLLTTIVGDYRLCLSPCESTEVLYADGSCRSACVSPFILVPTLTMQVCRSPCPAGYTILYNGTCSPLPCPYPLFNILSSGSMAICKYPCDNPAEIYYKNNASCMSACNFPYVTRTYDLFSACEPPCPDGYYFRYWDNTCQISCPPLLQPINISDILICDKPQCALVLCDPCGASSDCPDYYWCNTTLGAFCQPHYTQSIGIQEVKPILNGVILSVAIVPGLGIKAFEDILEFGIPTLQVDNDYTATIEKVGLGKYKIEIIIFQTLPQIQIISSFKYAPYTLGLQLDYTLPRIIYLNSDIQNAAQNTGKGSQIAFVIFVITILSYISDDGVASIWVAIPESQYSYYLLYLNIEYLYHTRIYLESLSNYDILVGNTNLDEMPSDMQYQAILPPKFFSRGYPPDFLENTRFLFFEAMATVVIITTSHLALRYLRLTGRNVLVLKAIDYLRKSLMWNLVIRQALTYSLPLSVACFIQIYTLMFGYNANLLSSVLSLVTLVLFLWGFNKMLSLITFTSKTKHEIIIHEKKFGTLWEDLDMNSIGRYYYWLVALRGCLLAYLAVFLSIFPYVQIGVLILYQLLIVSLFFKRSKIRPVFNNNALNKVTLAEEVCLLMVKCLILMSMIMMNSMKDRVLILIGWLTIIPAAVSQVLQIFYSIGSKLSDPIRFIKIYERFKAKLSNKKKIKRRTRRIMLRNIQVEHLED